MKHVQQRPAGHLAPRRQQNWDWRAAGNFVCGGAGGGLLFVAALAHLAGAEVRHLIGAGLLLVGTGLFCVWLEIGRPWRALNVFRHLRTSWMTREASVAPLLFISGALAVAGLHPALPLLTGLCGLAFLYSQARILAADKGIPAWRHPRCAAVVVATGLAEGAGLLAFAVPLLPARLLPAAALVLILALLARLWLWKRYLAGLEADGAPLGSLQALSAIERRFVLFGHLVPAASAIAAAIGVPGATAACILAGLMAVGGGWLFKYTLVRRAAFTQGIALKHLPVRGRGTPGPAVKPGWSGR